MGFVEGSHLNINFIDDFEYTKISFIIKHVKHVNKLRE